MVGGSPALEDLGDAVGLGVPGGLADHGPRAGWPLGGGSMHLLIHKQQCHNIKINKTIYLGSG